MFKKPTAIHSTFFAVCFALCTPFVASADNPITRIEETWVLKVVEPSSDISAPQITMVMTPNSNDQNEYFSFSLNHGIEPEISAGGLQLVSWSDSSTLDYTTKTSSDVSLQNNGERVVWRQSVTLADGELHFSVDEFQSKSWENYDVEKYLKLSMKTGLSNLDNYDHNDSLKYSVVSYSTNRVQYLKLVRVRAFDEDGKQVWNHKFNDDLLEELGN